MQNKMCPYGIEAYVRRDYTHHGSNTGIDSILSEKITEIDSVLAIGVGRGIFVIEMGMIYPNLKITAVNCELGLWDPSIAEEELLVMGYSEQNIRSSIQRINPIVADFQFEHQVSKQLGDQKFDFIFFEPGAVLEYMQNPLQAMELVFNNYLSLNGVFGAEINLNQFNYEMSDQSGNKLIDDILNKFANAGDVISEMDYGRSAIYYLLKKCEDINLPFKLIKSVPHIVNGIMPKYHCYYTPNS